MIEMAFRAYDPCYGCATHSLPGQMPLIVRIRRPDGEVIRRSGAIARPPERFRKGCGHDGTEKTTTDW